MNEIAFHCERCCPTLSQHGFLDYGILIFLIVFASIGLFFTLKEIVLRFLDD